MSLKNLIDSNGNLIASEEGIFEQEKLALEIMRNTLGLSIIKNNKRFILSELELYFGGIGDKAHDWYRRNFKGQYGDGKISRTSHETAKYQAMKGPIYYFNRKGGGKHKRCDIVMGEEGVAVSFLIRAVLIDESFELVSGPNNALNAMGLTDDDLGKEVEFHDSREYVFSKGFYIEEPRLRIISGKAIGFSHGCLHDKKPWNLFLKRA